MGWWSLHVDSICLDHLLACRTQHCSADHIWAMGLQLCVSLYLDTPWHDLWMRLFLKLFNKQQTFAFFLSNEGHSLPICEEFAYFKSCHNRSLWVTDGILISTPMVILRWWYRCWYWELLFAFKILLRPLFFHILDFKAGCIFGKTEDSKIKFW